MIKKPKKRFSSLPYFVLLIYLLLLAGLFVYASQYQSTFFIWVFLILIFQVIGWVLYQIHIHKIRSVILLQKEDYVERTNLLEVEVKKHQSAIEVFSRKIILFSELKKFMERMSLCLTLEDVSQTLMSEIIKLYGDPEPTMILYYYQGKWGELAMVNSYQNRQPAQLKAKKGDEFDLWVVKMRQPLLIEDAKSDFRFDMDKMRLEDQRPIRSLMSVPLILGNKLLGVLRLDSPQAGYFTIDELRFLSTLGDVGAVVIENAQLFEHLEDLAIHDGLTGLFLKRYLLERMPPELNRALRGGQEVSVLMMDLDYFKKYNDRYGHTAGDIVLKTIGNLLKEFFNHPGNLLCRYGGEEFAVILPNCPKKRALQFAEEIRIKIAEKTIELRREKTRMTVSIGLAVFPQDAKIKDELLQKADQALYQAKREGRNRVVVVNR